MFFGLKFAANIKMIQIFNKINFYVMKIFRDFLDLRLSDLITTYVIIDNFFPCFYV